MDNKAIHELASTLRKVEGDNPRLTRALLFSNALAMSIPIKGNNLEEDLPAVKRSATAILEKINDTCPLDIKLCLELISRVIRFRYILLNGAYDPISIGHTVLSNTNNLMQEEEVNAENERIYGNRDLALLSLNLFKTIKKEASN